MTRINISLDPETYGELDFLRFMLNGKSWNKFIKTEIIPMLKSRGEEIIKNFYLPYLQNFQFSDVDKSDFDHATNTVLQKYWAGELSKEFRKVNEK